MIKVKVQEPSMTISMRLIVPDYLRLEAAARAEGRPVGAAAKDLLLEALKTQAARPPEGGQDVV